VAAYKKPPSKARSFFVDLNSHEETDEEHEVGDVQMNEEDKSVDGDETVTSTNKGKADDNYNEPPRMSTKDKLKQIVQQERSLIDSARKRTASGKK
jgi:hypothetical protein